jgi:hypothetical protein
MYIPEASAYKLDYDPSKPPTVVETPPTPLPIFVVER